MKKSYILIALAMLAALSMTSCKNNKKNQNQEPTQEEIQAQKQALADSVLAKIDSLTEQFMDAKSKSFSIQKFELTEAEKMVKPDYLLDPSEVNKFVTKSQKINALAIYYVELTIREIYEMPVDAAKECIGRLATDINYPIDFYIQHLKDMPTSERKKDEYNKCKEDGNLNCFWQFQEAISVELSYLLVQNPDMIFDRISEDQWQAFRSHTVAAYYIMKTLAEYDEEIASIMKKFDQYHTVASIKEHREGNSTKESAKQFRIAHKDKYVARRSALLQ